MSRVNLPFYGPMYGPDHPKGPTKGPQVLAWKRMMERWDPDVLPGTLASFDDVYNRVVAGGTRVMQRWWGIDASGNVGEATFDRSLDALRGRGHYKPVESAWDKLAISLYKSSAPKIPPARCFPLPKGKPKKIISDRSGHMARRLGNWQSDNAIDIWGTPGTPVLAPKAGYCSRGGGVDPHRGPVGTIFGEHCTIHCPDGDAFFFTHIARIVEVGERLLAGQVIGYIGDWPRSSAMDHAHMGRIWGRNPEEVIGWPQVQVTKV